MEPVDLSICYCGWGYNRPMIMCAHCHRWYHLDCVCLTLKKASEFDKWYCFECDDFKPASDEDEEYDFEEDQRLHRERNMETRKRVRIMLGDENFNKKSVESMDIATIRDAICCIEQQLLIEDDSPSIHCYTSACDEKNMMNRRLLLRVNPYLDGLYSDVYHLRLQKRLINLQTYIQWKEQASRLDHMNPAHSEEWMVNVLHQMNQIDIPLDCVGIYADVRSFPWETFGRLQRSLVGRLFDAIMIDPPWQLSSADPIRGVAIGYRQLEDACIAALPLHCIQSNGLLFMWTINAKYSIAIHMIQHWGYRIIGDITWIKQSNRGFMIQSNGYYLQHAKETCFVAQIGSGDYIDPTVFGSINDVIYSKRKGQSQKPNEIYGIIERLIPQGYFLEIFGRRNNLRSNWVTIGDEI